MDSVDASLFDAFDYVALGHLHSPQKMCIRDRGWWWERS